MAFYLEACYSGSGCGTIRGKALIDLAWTGPGQVQWSHEFDLVACGFISSLVSAESLPFTFVSWPLFCSSVKHPHPCFPPRNESKVYRGYFAGGLYTCSSGDLL